MPTSSPDAPCPPSCDVAVIGAGPVGLFAAFQFGLLGMRPLLIDPLPAIGGQLLELYPDKPIYDIPGWPCCTGRELAERLMMQLRPFAVPLHLGLQVSALVPAGAGEDAGYRLETVQATAPSQAGPQFAVRMVCITAGVGAFVPRPLPGLPGDALAPYEPAQVHWSPTGVDEHATDGPHVVVGGGPEAVAGILALGQRSAEPLTVVHRRDLLQADEAALDTVNAWRAQGRIEVVAGQISGVRGNGQHLAGVTVTTPEGTSRELPANHLWVLQGLSARLGPIADWGIALERRRIAVDPATMATSLPGVYAAGDVVNYPGKRRLIVCGFHEATLAAYAAAERVAGGSIDVQYTTTSAVLQRRLGVVSD